MLKFWASGPSDQTTPKASSTAAANHDPFDALPGPSNPDASSKSPATLPESSQPRSPTHQSSFHPLSAAAGSGARTPRPSSHIGQPDQLIPGAVTHASPTTSLTMHHPEFGLSLGATKDKRGLERSSVAASSSTSLSALANTITPKPSISQPRPTSIFGKKTSTTTTATTTTPSNPPNSDDSSPAHPTSGQLTPKPGSNISPAMSRSGSNAFFQPLRGRLTVHILEAKDLKDPSIHSPYVVATFDQNEFVSRVSVSQHDAMDTNSPSDLHHPKWNEDVCFDVVHDQSPLCMSVFSRGSDSTDPERFLGRCEFIPKLIAGKTQDFWLNLRTSEDELVSGEMHVSLQFEKLETKRSLSVKDFEFLRMIGKGTFGKVFLVRKLDTKRAYAMKVLSKKEIVAKKEVAHTIGERKILQQSSQCPFLLGLKFSFQSETDLYMVMDYKSGGELFHHLQKEGRFTEERARFYTAEIVLAFEYLHSYDIVYRDLKPENILLDATGHIALCDFGLSKSDLPSDALTNTFCGTTEYLAPEVLLDDHGYSKLVDFWSLGVLLFEMVCGWSPFYAEDTQQMYRQICFGKIRFPKSVIGDAGKQLVKGLLNRNPKHRLGAQKGTTDLKEHPFFALIDWDALSKRKITPPFKPIVDSDESVANFDAEFTEVDVGKEVPLHYDDDYDFRKSRNGTLSDASQEQDESNGKGVAIGKPRRGRDVAGTPLTRSVQDAFAGFSFTALGESMVHNDSSPFLSNKYDDADEAEDNSDEDMITEHPKQQQTPSLDKATQNQAQNGKAPGNITGVSRDPDFRI